jgi:hypothetical protein
LFKDVVSKPGRTVFCRSDPIEMAKAWVAKAVHPKRVDGCIIDYLAVGVTDVDCVKKDRK